MPSVSTQRSNVRPGPPKFFIDAGIDLWNGFWAECQQGSVWVRNSAAIFFAILLRLPGVNDWSSFTTRELQTFYQRHGHPLADGFAHPGDGDEEKRLLDAPPVLLGNQNGVRSLAGDLYWFVRLRGLIQQLVKSDRAFVAVMEVILQTRTGIRLANVKRRGRARLTSSSITSAVRLSPPPPDCSERLDEPLRDRLRRGVATGGPAVSRRSGCRTAPRSGHPEQSRNISPGCR